MDRILKFYDTVKDEVCTKLLHEISPLYKYHSLRHTLDVIETSMWIGQAECISEEEQNILKVAALFHDSGYLRTRRNHEEASCEIFREYIAGTDFPVEKVPLIEGCIMATKIPQQPNNHLDRIICDADLDYLGRDDFFQIGELLYEEMMGCTEINSREQWDNIQIKFLESQTYQTDYCRKMRQVVMEENLQVLKERYKA
ncbi:MAG: HD domain-containing protein [Flavobacteriales bacterium]